MQLEDIDWYKKTQLYVLVIDSFVKFGITNNWERRKKSYNKEFENQKIILIKTYDFPNRWQAELIEQIVKWRLKKWIVYGRHEYTQLPIKQVLGCIIEVIGELKNEYSKHEYIHKKGYDRWDFYKQIAQIFFQEIKIEMSGETAAEPPELPEVSLYCNGYSESKIGKSAYGVILIHNEHEKKTSEVYRLTTTNRIDLLGIISGLQKLKKKSRVFVYTNSMYIVNPFNKNWIKNWVENNWVSNKKNIVNVNLWKQLLELTQFHEVTFLYSKDRKMLECLSIAEIAFKNSNILIDEFYENPVNQEQIESVAVQKEQVNLKIKKDGDLCRKCNTPVIQKTPSRKKIKKNQSYYFEYYMFCPNCKTMYMVEEARKTI